ncbi:MAG: hypothetical protein NWS34_02725, partial [Schleiferiaceae bacterium]|nr:hypothetical protein [Schleiferiaceae bacterium]
MKIKFLLIIGLTIQANLLFGQLVVGNISGSTTICQGQVPNSLTYSGSSNTSGTVTLIWQYSLINSLNDGDWSDILGAGSSIFSPGALSATRYYRVKVSDATGNYYSSSASIIIQSLPVVSAGNDITVCIGASLTLGATGAQTYIWDNGISDGAAFTPTATTTYTVTGTDANGCINTDQVVVTVNALPTVNAGADFAVCNGTSVTLTASGDGSFIWDNTVTNNVAFTPTATKTYTVTATANGCTNTDQVVVTVNPLPTVGAGIDRTVCSGTSVTLAGSGASTYTWDNSVTNATAFVAMTTTTYTVTGTDVNGCTNTDQVVVTVNSLPTVDAGNPATVCLGSPVTLTGSGATSYSWSNEVSNGAAFTPTATTTYTVTGTGANGCSNTDQVLVTVNALPNVNAGLDVSACVGS